MWLFLDIQKKIKQASNENKIMFDFDLKGIAIGDDRVKNWLVSLIISSLFGFFVILPIQVFVKNIDLK
jgi:hypothetical protein